jgi:hypothetical protein
MNMSSLTRLRVFAVTAAITSVIVVAQGMARGVSVVGIMLSLVLPLLASWWWSDETRRFIVWLSEKVQASRREERPSGDQR